MSERLEPNVSQPGNDDVLTDDNFHTPETEEWWEHETIWFWWFNAERRLGAWHYHYLRPNVGVAGGGLFVFDDTSWFHMEAPYYFNYSNTPMPEDPDFRDVTFPSGERFQMLDPLQHYRITFADRDSIDLEIDWRAVGKPWVRVGGQPHTKQGDQSDKPRHFDQFGHVTGTLELHGETVPIDCYAMRDRSWWHLRPEFWKRGGGTSTYITCMADPDTAFFGAGPGGFLLLDGVRRPLLSGSVRRERDDDWGFMRRIVVTGTDYRRARVRGGGRERQPDGLPDLGRRRCVLAEPRALRVQRRGRVRRRPGRVAPQHVGRVPPHVERAARRARGTLRPDRLTAATGARGSTRSASPTPTPAGRPPRATDPWTRTAGSDTSPARRCRSVASRASGPC